MVWYYESTEEVRSPQHYFDLVNLLHRTKGHNMLFAETLKYYLFYVKGMCFPKFFFSPTSICYIESKYVFITLFSIA